MLIRDLCVPQCVGMKCTPSSCFPTSYFLCNIKSDIRICCFWENKFPRNNAPREAFSPANNKFCVRCRCSIHTWWLRTCFYKRQTPRVIPRGGAWACTAVTVLLLLRVNVYNWIRWYEINRVYLAVCLLCTKTAPPLNVRRDRAPIPIWNIFKQTAHITSPVSIKTGAVNEKRIWACLEEVSGNHNGHVGRLHPRFVNEYSCCPKMYIGIVLKRGPELVLNCN